MKLLLALFTAALMAGCAAPIHKHEVTNLQKSETVKVVDVRPKQESEQELFSALITSDAYGLYRFSTHSLDPSAERLFQHKVYEKFPDAAQPLNITVYHFVTYWNMQSSFRKTSLGSAFGIIGAAVAASSQKYDADFRVYDVNADLFNQLNGDKEYQRAYFSEEENPDKVPVFIVYLDAEINGKRSFIKGIAPSTRKDGKHSYLTAVDDTVQAFLSKY